MPALGEKGKKNEKGIMVLLTDLQNVCFLQHLAKSTGGC
jgi:hypothetical protein